MILQCNYEATKEPAPEGEIHYKCINCGHERFSRNKPPYIRYDCKTTKKNPVTLDTILSSYQKAVKEWKEAGKPLRTKERILEIFIICESNKCGHFRVGIIRNSCALCKCNLNLLTIGEFNKIAMGTQICPDDPPRWT